MEVAKVKEVVKFYTITASNTHIFGLDSEGRVWSRMGTEPSGFVKWELVDSPEVEKLGSETASATKTREQMLSDHVAEMLTESHEMRSQLHQYKLQSAYNTEELVKVQTLCKQLSVDNERLNNHIRMTTGASLL